MTKTIRSVALAVAGAALLSACSVFNALIPDQDVAEGVLGIGTAGVQVPLAADVELTGIGGAQLITVTEFTGTLAIDSVDVEAIEDLPDFVEAAAITETVTLGDTVVVTFPTDGAAVPFTLNELAVTGSVTISGATYAFPVFTASDLEVLFTDAVCADGVCTYGTASGLPEIDVEIAAGAVAAYSALLQGGGTIAAELTVTATLDAPGLAADAQVVVTIESLGAVIEF
jgi:hypothetical protein